MNQTYRELTPKEKKGIRELIHTHCANYEKHSCECLLLDTQCPMRLKHYHNGKLCKYFEQSVLPLDEVLQNHLQGKNAYTKEFALCHTSFLSKGRKKYCSVDCANIANQKATKERVRKHRRNKEV